MPKLTTFLVSFSLLTGISYARPRETIGPEPGGLNYKFDNGRYHSKLQCSAHTSDAIPAWLPTLETQAAWRERMLSCLDNLNADNYDGNECRPAAGQPTFGFYKGKKHYEDFGPVDCFQRCEECLAAGINATQAVTTKCDYQWWTGALRLGNPVHTCTMGFEYHDAETVTDFPSSHPLLNDGSP